MQIDIAKLAKDVFSNKELIIENLPDDKVKIWYRNKRAYRSIGGSDPRPFILPKSIELDQEFAEAIGLYLGDGKTTKKDTQHLEFSNKDHDIVNFMLNFFTSKFLVGLNNMTITIKYKTENREEVLKKWSELLKIPESKFKICYVSRNKYDTLSMQINSTVLRKTFDGILKAILPFIESNKNLRRGFLRGYFAAEGNIGFKRKDNYIEYIGFSYNASKENHLRDFCIDCLNLEGIDARYKEKNNAGLVYTNRWENYYKMWLIKIFDRCLRKKEDFEKILFTRELYCDLNEGFRIRLLKTNLTQRKVAEIIGSWQGNVCRTLAGRHLLRIEQIMVLSEYQSISKEDILDNVKRIRIGNTRSLIYDKTLINNLF